MQGEHDTNSFRNEHERCQTAVASIRPGPFLNFYISNAGRTKNGTNRFIFPDRSEHEQARHNVLGAPSEVRRCHFENPCGSEQTLRSGSILFFVTRRFYPWLKGAFPRSEIAELGQSESSKSDQRGIKVMYASSKVRSKRGRSEIKMKSMKRHSVINGRSK